MNDFFSKYRWQLIIAVVGIAIVLALFFRSEPPVEETPVEEPKTVEAPAVEEETAAEPEPVIEETPAVVVAEETPTPVKENEIEEPAVSEGTHETIEPVIDEVEEPTEESSTPEASPAEEAIEAEEPEVVVEEATEEAPINQEDEIAEEAPVVEEVIEPVVEEEATIEAAEPEVSVAPDALIEVSETDEAEAVVEEIPAEEKVAEVTETTIPEPTVEVVVDEVVEETTEEESVVEEVSEPAAEEPVEQIVEEDPPIQEAATVEEVVEEVASVITQATEGDFTIEGLKPTFDVVRVDATGMAVIAGTAEPNSTVSILSNGEQIGEAVADMSGKFVAIVQVLESEEGQTLELETEIAGQLLFSDETILILPILQSEAAESIEEETAPAIVRATEDEVVIVQGAAQLALGQVSLDSISYDENGEVVLAGRGTPGRTIIIYVNDKPLIDALVSESGSWKQALHGLDAGRYILRIDEIDDEGTVKSRVETPFQREFPEDVREAKSAMGNTYTVQYGNSLWRIARRKYGEGIMYHQIFSANKDQIRDPDLIYPGQVFALPETKE